MESEARRGGGVAQESSSVGGWWWFFPAEVSDFHLELGRGEEGVVPQGVVVHLGGGGDISPSRPATRGMICRVRDEKKEGALGAMRRFLGGELGGGGFWFLRQF